MTTHTKVPMVPEGFVLAYIPAALLTRLMTLDPTSFTINMPVAAMERVDVTEAVSLAPSPVEMPTEPMPVGKRRGRVPGRYRLMDEVTVDEATLTPSERSVLRQMSQRRRGMTARALATRLNIPQGTVGWAIARMVKAGLVQYMAASPTKHHKAPAATASVEPEPDHAPVLPVEPRRHRGPRTHRIPAGYVPLTQHHPLAAHA